MSSSPAAAQLALMEKRESESRNAYMGPKIYNEKNYKEVGGVVVVVVLLLLVVVVIKVLVI